MKTHYDSKFKSRVALAAIAGDRTIAEIAGEYGISDSLCPRRGRGGNLNLLLHWSLLGTCQ